MGKQEYRSAIRSRKLIRVAFVELMHEKPVEKISVTDIVTRADINRGTFYAHYMNVNDLISKIRGEIIEKLNEFLDELTDVNMAQNPQPLFDKLADFLMQDEEFYELLILSRYAGDFLIELENTFVNRLANCMVPNENNAGSVRAFTVFLAGGLSSIYRSWFANDIDMSLRELSRLLGKFVRDSFRPFMLSISSESQSNAAVAQSGEKTATQ